MSNNASQTAMAASFHGVNHLKLPCFSINKKHDFYPKILPFTPLPQYDHFTPDHKLFAKMCEHAPTKLIIETRYVPSQAAAQKGWDPITYGVSTRKDLDRWVEWFESKSVKYSRILFGGSRRANCEAVR